MCLERGRINRDGPRLGLRSRQTIHHPHENTYVASMLPTVVERPVRIVFSRCTTPTQAITVQKNDAVQYTAVINARFAVALRKERSQTLYLFIRQSIQVAHLQSPCRA
ncbi:hypothetical protein AD937_06660 [Gluconobacter japonicus]|nr:hypothetical protein AD937_06660 [Gluconobacter japonicus]